MLKAISGLGRQRKSIRVSKEPKGIHPRLNMICETHDQTYTGSNHGCLLDIHDINDDIYTPEL